MLTEPPFSKLFSVAPDGALSGEIKSAIVETLRSSPKVFDFQGKSRFRIVRDEIEFKPFTTKFIPLAFSTSRMDGRMPNAFIADEVGALPTSYPIDAMRSGQLNMANKLGFIISTKYPTINNPLENEVAYAKKILDKTVKDDTVFALLYEPDETTGWENNDLILQQANPVALEIPEIWDDLLKKRARAIEKPNERENFVTKHCNIIYQGLGTETYIDVADVQKCKVDKINWTGRTVYIGVDLSTSDDNTSVVMTGVDDDDETILCEAFAFIPGDRIFAKSQHEKVDYQDMIQKGHVHACGGRIIDYSYVEEFVASIEEKYKVAVQGVGFDPWNSLSSAQKWEEQGLNCVVIRPHSSVLHAPTKRLKEHILSGKFKYTDNLLLEINFQNAKCTFDTNQNAYVNKKKSSGKVDMVAALINGVYLLEQFHFLDHADFIVQTIETGL